MRTYCKDLTYCVNNNLDRSEVIRAAIEFYLSCMYPNGRVYRLNSIEENLQSKKGNTLIRVYVSV
jgi:hypothetical protein